MEKLTLTKAAAAPVTTDDIREWCRLDDGQDEALLAGLIQSAVTAAEARTNRSLSAATVEYSFAREELQYQQRAYGGDHVELCIPAAPVNGITKLEIEDQYGNRSTVSTASYVVRVSDTGATLSTMQIVPCYARFVVTAEVGYADAASIPQAIKHAIAVHVGSSFEGREGQDKASATFDRLLSPLAVEYV